jgi:hypothetical protein
MNIKTLVFTVTLIILFGNSSTAQSDIIKKIYFDVGKSTLSNTTNENVEIDLSQCEGYDILLEGHTDNTGSGANNQKLSEERVATVKKMLLERGVRAERIQTKAFGAKKPIVPNINPENKAQNRNVTIRLVESVVMRTERLKKETAIIDNKLLSLIDETSNYYSIKQSDKEQTIIAQKGTMITIPANAFRIKEGKELQIKVTEVYDKSDMLLYNLATVSNGKPLVTGGMIKVEAFSRDQPVSLQEGKSLQIAVPTETPNKEMQLFASEITSDGNMNWVTPKPLAIQNKNFSTKRLDWRLEAPVEYANIPYRGTYPEFDGNLRPVDSAKIFKIKIEVETLENLDPNSYKNYRVRKNIFGRKKRIRIYPAEETAHAAAIEKEVNKKERKISREEKRIARYYKNHEKYRQYLTSVEEYNRYWFNKDSIIRLNLEKAITVRDLYYMRQYSDQLSDKEAIAAWARVYGMSEEEYEIWQWTKFDLEKDEKLYQKAMAEKDTLAFNLFQTKLYTEKFAKALYQTESLEEAYIAHLKYKNREKYRLQAAEQGITVEELIGRELAEQELRNRMAYTFQMSQLGKFVNCDYFLRTPNENLLAHTELDVPLEAGVTRTMMVFKNHKIIMGAAQRYNKTRNVCIWANIPVNEPVKIISVYLNKKQELQVSIRSKKATRNMGTVGDYKPMSDQEFLVALQQMN